MFDEAKDALVPGLSLSEIHLCSSISPDCRAEVERLFFFNPKQFVVSKRVEAHIIQYGKPEICIRGNSISFELTLVDHAQTIFLMDSGRVRLLGVVIYVREGDFLRALYVALKYAYTMTRNTSSELLLFIVEALRKIARSVRGVRGIKLSIGPRDATFNV